MSRSPGVRTRGAAARAWLARPLVAAIGSLLLGSAALHAIEPESGSEEVASDSPRAAVTAYLDLCRAGDYEGAARYLTLGPPRKLRGADLARRLKAVLDARLWIDLDALSPVPEGELSDGLAPAREQIGTIFVGAREVPVRLSRGEGDDSPAWAFAPETVAQVDHWYGTLGHLWLRERLPDSLLRPGPLELAWWQWAALPILLLLAWSLGRVSSWVALRVLVRVARRTEANWDDELVQGLSGPIVFGGALAAAYPLTRSLSLYPPAQDLVGGALGTIGLVVLFWALWRAAGVAGRAMGNLSWARENASAQALLSIGVRFGRAAIFAAGAVALLSRLGYPVASLLAGLGLGGLAFALAAQKTVENLFGSLSLAVDAPFRIGDFVKVEEFVGTVEAVGLRSTRIRTLDRTVVTLPNGRLSDMRLESYSARDRMRLACTVGLVYDTRAEQMRNVLQGLERVLRAHPLIWPDAVVVRFKEFGASSLDIEVMAWFETRIWAEFQLVRQEVLLQFMEVVEGAGTSFAFPTRTVHLVGEPAAEAAPALP